MAGGTARLTPDVAAPADPNTGALVILNGGGQTIGGTGWSAPTWAGLGALINQARVAAGKSRLGFLNPLLYSLDPAACFRDVTAGQNGAYNCSEGYDLVTGLGSPRVKNLLAALVQKP